MLRRIRGVLKHVLMTALYGSVGAVIALVTVYVITLNDRPDLSVWHVADLDEEFTVKSDVSTFEEYLALEDRLFKQLDEKVYQQVKAEKQNQINRFTRNSLSDPNRWPQNWNRSYVMPVDTPRAAILLLHGMSDSPYSLRNLAQTLHSAGAYVLGLRIPGHGTAPSGLIEVTWQDMDAAVRLAVRHLAKNNQGQPIYIVGYSNGAALAVNYALETLEDPELVKVDGLAILSPEIGISKAAALAVWQARLGHLLGLDKLAWNGLLPEYDPYKYGSFAVNAGDVAHRITLQIQNRIKTYAANGQLRNIPPILAFSSIVDATVTAPALIKALFNKLTEGGHELVMFDINRESSIKPLIKWNSDAMNQAFDANPDREYIFSLVTNLNTGNRSVTVQITKPGDANFTETPLHLGWPTGIYSLAHVALPFPPDDPLYGGLPTEASPGINLGDLALRGERGVLLIPPAEMLRLRWNPFYPYVESRILDFFMLK